MAYDELEQRAIRYAMHAVQSDNNGDRSEALEHYKKAVDLLRKLVEISPDYDLNKFYIQRAFTYQKRIEILERTEWGEGGSTQISTTRRAASREEQFSLSKQTATENPNVKWSEVVGLDDVKRVVREVIVYPIQRPDLFPLGWPRGILLFGPPGCGKTLLAAAVATEIDAEFVSIDSASIMSKWLGESEKNVAGLFNWARGQERKGRPVIIFVDELDSLIGMRQAEIGGEVRVRNQLLKEMDGIIDKNKKSYIYVIGATNKPWDLDAPFIRRFQKRIYVPLPDEKTRLELFKFYTREINLSPSVDLRELARITEGYSGSDIRDICQDVYLKKISYLFESGLARNAQIKPKPVSISDFKKILKTRKASVLPHIVPAYEKWISVLQAM